MLVYFKFKKVGCEEQHPCCDSSTAGDPSPPFTGTLQLAPNNPTRYTLAYKNSVISDQQIIIH